VTAWKAGPSSTRGYGCLPVPSPVAGLKFSVGVQETRAGKNASAGSAAGWVNVGSILAPPGLRAGALVRPQAGVGSGAVRFSARRVFRLVVVAAASNRREADGLWSAF
jgi:hypothetical protein